MKSSLQMVQLKALQNSFIASFRFQYLLGGAPVSISTCFSICLYSK